MASVRAVIRRNARLQVTKPVWELYPQPRLASILRAGSVSTRGRYLYKVKHVPRHPIVLIQLYCSLSPVVQRYPTYGDVFYTPRLKAPFLHLYHHQRHHPYPRLPSGVLPEPWNPKCCTIPSSQPYASSQPRRTPPAGRGSQVQLRRP